MNHDQIVAYLYKGEQGVRSFNKLRTRYPNLQINLNGQDLSGRDLSGANFKGIFAWRTWFSSCLLNGTNFDGATLIGANFENANLTRASFRSVNLENASFRKATLHNVDFNFSFLRGVDFYAAKEKHSNFRGTTANPYGNKHVVCTWIAKGVKGMPFTAVQGNYD